MQLHQAPSILPLHQLVRCLPEHVIARRAAVVSREWLVTNGLGGYASASVANLPTRKYHGLLVAALPNPLGRTVMLDHVSEALERDGFGLAPLGAEDSGPDGLDLQGLKPLAGFRLEAGLPVWDYEFAGQRVEKRVLMPHGQNSTVLLWRHVAGDVPLRLLLRPAVHFRHHEHELSEPLQPGYRLLLGPDLHEIACEGAPATLRLWLPAGAAFMRDEREWGDRHYRIEAERGYAFVGRLWSPGRFALTLEPGGRAALVASTEDPETLCALAPEEAWAAEHERRRELLRAAPASARDGAAAELVLAADAFLVTPTGRRRDAVRAAAEGEALRSVIAGYHWFTDWGRDTMISLEGLALATGRFREAARILLTFCHYVRDGLLPNMFPDGSNEGLYHTADATLWLFHAVDRYRRVTGDLALVERVLPTLDDIARRHLAGTRFGIAADPRDGLLSQGADGYQLTWMDAKCEGVVITPRRGKAVEINALWYQALCVLRDCSALLSGPGAAAPWHEAAARAQASFNRRFWWDGGGYLFDVVDGPDGDSRECRPNQLFAVSLPYAVLDPARWARVLEVVERRLVTPFGLRSLAPDSADYVPRYAGRLPQRDAAYHQGTVWAWLIGPWIDAWRKGHPDEDPRRWLEPLLDHLGDYGVGSIAEIFDAEPPHAARGCIAQAWSVAEVLRQWVAATAARAPEGPAHPADHRPSRAP